MKTKAFVLTGLLFAVALAISCDSDGGTSLYGCISGDCNVPKPIPGGSTLQNPDMNYVNSNIPTGQDEIISNVQFSGSGIAGGATTMLVTASEALNELYLQVPGESGHYVRQLTQDDIASYQSGVYVYSIALQLSQGVANGQMQVTVSGRSTERTVSSSTASEVRIIRGGTGALQIILSWDQMDDLDLYVQTPSDRTLYFGDRVIPATPTVGKAELDIDSNAGCEIDGINSENLFFEAPLQDGTYTVGVNLYSKCSSSLTRPGAKYSVTANFKGQPITFAPDRQNGQFAANAESAEIVIGTITIRNGALAVDREPTQFTVSFNTNGGTPATINPVTVDSGTTLGARFPANPTRAGYTFEGWFSGEGTTRYTSSTAVTGSVTLTARWEEGGGDEPGEYDFEPVRIGSLTWTKNINIETDDSWCYNNDPANCAKYGRLYTWEAAKSACAIMDGEWRLPDTADWRALVRFGSTGKKLKATSGWNNNGNGTDDYGFSALPGGYRHYVSSFDNVGSRGVWWSATERDGDYDYAYGRSMYYNNDNVSEDYSSKTYGYSVRCVQGAGTQPTTYTLTVTRTPAAGGTVYVNGSAATGTTTHNAGASVEVVAEASAGYEFTGWSGASTSTDAGIVVTMSANRTLTANFRVRQTGGGDYTGGSAVIGDLTWMTENLNIETDDSWCYNNDPANCAKYGRLYTWEAAKSACAIMDGGWRLPDTADWGALVTYAGGPSTAGKKLKATSGWNNNGNGTDDYGFSALPGGYYNTNSGSFGTVGYSGNWWSSTADRFSSDLAHYRDMAYNNDSVRVNILNYKSHGFSVRCVED